MNRRDFIKTLAAAGIATAIPLHAVDHGPALKEAARAHGILFGTEATRKELERDPEYAALVVKNAAILTPGLELKWDMLRPDPDRFDFVNAEWLLRFAATNKMKVHGHTLLWHEALPEWLKLDMNRKNAMSLVERHVDTVVKKFKGKIYAWDVVNEIIEPSDRRPDNLKKSIFLENIGPEFIERAFHIARAADPSALLVWNENWLESDSNYCVAKRDATLKLLTELKKRNCPVDVLGLQAHLKLDVPLSADLPRFLSNVRGLGVKIAVTELDVRERNAPQSTFGRDRDVAGRYKEFLSICSRFAECIQTWGLSDRYTWINSQKRNGAEALSRPLIFDSELNPKAAHAAVLEALKSVA